MITSFGITGLARSALAAAVMAGASVALPGAPANAAGDAPPPHIERQTWSFAGIKGRFDTEQLQRGFQVYQEVCASCHGLKRVYFRNLSEPGGPEFNEEAVKALAASWPNQIFDGPNEQGDIATRKGQIIKRPARLSDPILGPYDNDNQARAAQNGALPPDLSIITKARTVEYHGSVGGHVVQMMKDILNAYQESGPDYVHALLTGYKNAPADFKLAPGMNYNSAFPGNQIAMTEPLTNGRVKYQSKDIPATVDQYSRDVTAFLAWAADPRLNERKGMGWLVMLYLAITAVLLYFAKRKLWSSVH
ncbi:MAG: cytochrome c1 [Hyphomicrobiaceae bacterium]|nr:cytochrome c1 [Hyphomicrobiaceae bacterium]